MYVASCQIQNESTTSAGGSPSTAVTIGKRDCATNTTTFAPISACSVVEIGPGPNEKEEAYGEAGRRIDGDPNRTTSCLSATFVPSAEAWLRRRQIQKSAAPGPFRQVRSARRRSPRPAGPLVRTDRFPLRWDSLRDTPRRRQPPSPSLRSPS